MTNGIGFFEVVATAGHHQLEAIGGQAIGGAQDRSVLQRYLELIKGVFALLSQIHDAVLDTVIEAREAASLEKARQIMTGLQGVNLRDTLKAHDLCEQLRDKGNELRPMVQADNLISDQDRIALLDITYAMEVGEGNTAALYDSKLYDLHQAIYQSSQLEETFPVFDAIAQELSTQKAQFDLIVRRAQARLASLSRAGG